MTMFGRDPVRTVGDALTPITDAQTILEAIVSNDQANIFLIDVLAGGDFAYARLVGDGNSTYAELARASYGQTPEDLFGPVDGAAVRAHYRECIVADGTIVYEERLHVQGEDRWWQTNLTPLKNGAGTIVQILGIAIDITERKRVESRLSETERQFQTIVANIPGVVYRRIRSTDGRLTYHYISDRITVAARA